MNLKANATLPASRVCGAMLRLSTCVLACSSANDGVHYTGTPGHPVKALPFANLLLADASVDGVGGALLAADTGSPDVVLSPQSFPGVALPAAGGPVDSLAFGGLTFLRPTIVSASVSSPDPTVPFGGVVGCSILSAFSLSLNYRDAQITLGPASTPQSVETPGASTGFDLEGPSRISIPVIIEGSSHALVLDTGSSYVLLRTDLFAQLTGDGRTQISLSASAIRSTSTATASRLKWMTAVGLEVTGVVATADSSRENLLDQIASEVGHPVDGLIGGGFLRNFFVTIDYPNHVLRLQRYVTGGPTFDEFDRVGVTLAATAQGSGYQVASVLAGTDAAQKGVAVGDSIGAIDGHPLGPLGPWEATVLLSGPPGSQKMVQFGGAQSAALTNQTVALRVDELLPP